MQWYEILITILTLLSVSSIFGLIWKSVHEKVVRKYEHLNELKNNEQEESLRKIIREETKELTEKVDSVSDKINVINEGVVCTLRNDILNCYHECCSKGYRDERDYSNIHHLYDCYVKLGGNSFVEGLIKEFDALPSEDLFKKKEYKVEI